MLAPPAEKLMSAQPALLFKQRDRARKPDRHAVEQGLPVDLPVDLAVLQRPLETENGVRQRLVDQGAIGNIGAEREGDQPVAALGTSLRRQLAGGTIGEQRQVVELEIEIEVGGTAGERAIGHGGGLAVEDPQLPRDDPGLAARQAAGDAGIAGKQIVDRLAADPKPRRDAVDRQVERAVDRLDAAGSVHVEGAGQLASRQLRERRDAGSLHLDVAVECVVGDVAGQQNAEVVARQLSLGQADGSAGFPVAGDVQLELLAKRLGDIGPDGRDAGRRAG